MSNEYVLCVLDPRLLLGILDVILVYRMVTWTETFRFLLAKNWPLSDDIHAG